MPAVFFTEARDEIATTLPPSTLAFILERGKPRSIPQGLRVIGAPRFKEPPPLLVNDRGERLTEPNAPRDLSDPRISAECRAAVRAWEARRDEYARTTGDAIRATAARPEAPRGGEPPTGGYHIGLYSAETGAPVACGFTRELARVNELAPLDVRAGDLLAAWVGGRFRLAWVASL